MTAWKEFYIDISIADLIKKILKACFVEPDHFSNQYHK